MVLEGNRSLGHHFSDWNPASQIQTSCLHGKHGIGLNAMLEGRTNKGGREHTSDFPFHFNHHFSLLSFLLNFREKNSKNEICVSVFH